MSDETNFKYIKTKLDIISKTLINIHKEISYETINIHKVTRKPHKPRYLSEDSKKLKRNTSKFFLDFLKPLLERETTSKRVTIVERYKKIKGTAEVTIGNYIRELEDKDSIRSERDNLDGKTKIYRLKNI